VTWWKLERLARTVKNQRTGNNQTELFNKGNSSSLCAFLAEGAANATFAPGIIF
jgi:hypothetical protein